jgi:DNA polymerase III delta prime subunit
VTGNPFSPGVFQADLPIVGREQHLDVIQKAVEQIELGRPHCPVCFVGSTGIGKTTLLKRIAKNLREENWICGYTEASEDVNAALADLLVDVGRLAKPTRAMRKWLSQVNSLNFAIPSGAAIGFGLRDPASESMYASLVDLFQKLSDTARFEAVGVALLLDETQMLPDPALRLVLRALNAIEESSIVLIMAALSTLYEKIGPGPRTAEHVLLSELRPLPHHAAKEMLSERIAASGAQVTSGALSAMLIFAEGHPLTLQMLGWNAWNNAANGQPGHAAQFTIEDKHAEVAVAEVRAQLMPRFHGPAWRTSDDGERAVLKVLAGMKDAPTEADILRRLPPASSPEGHLSLYNLVDRDVLSRQGDEIRFVIPGFKEYVCAR